jgi:hypothetical protein
MNPTIDNVVKAYRRVATHPISIKIDRTGVVLPQGQHFQGIQRFPGKQRDPRLLVITSSSNSVPYFVPCAMADDWLSGQASSPVIMAKKRWNHAGGCQAVGQFLVVGLENLNIENGSEVQFWNCRQSPPKPRRKMTIHRAPKGKTSTAGAVGLTWSGMGAVLAVASYNATTVDFYRSKGNPFKGSRLKRLFKWKASDAKKTDWIDKNFGHYQNVNLVTQTNGDLYMVAFDLGGGTDWMDLYSVNLGGHPRSALKKVAKKKMYCTNGCTFNDGSGIYIPSSDRFEVYAVKGKSGDHVTGTTIYANYFPAR